MNLVYLSGCPFSQQIQGAPLPPKFKPPVLEKYDGSADPSDHLQNFQMTMALLGSDEATLCKTFPTTLRKAAKDWFNNIPEGSVGGWKQLADSFLHQFISSRRPKKSEDYLNQVKQKSGESLRSYLARFNQEALTIPNLQPGVALSAVKKGLREGKFRFSLFKRPPKDLPEFNARAEKYMGAEELTEALCGGTKQRAGNERREDDRKKRDRVFTTELSAPMSEVLSALQSRGLLTERPPKIRYRGKNRGNPNLFCKYHDDHGHDTDGCYVLERKLNGLAKAGEINEFMRARRTGNPPPDRRLARPENSTRGIKRDSPSVRSNRRSRTPERRPGRRARTPERRRQPRRRSRSQESRRQPRQERERERNPVAHAIETINFIAGGPGASGDSSRKRKAHVHALGITSVSGPCQREHPDLVFSPKDGISPDPTHEDPLVISALIARKFYTRRILVDTGSSADILFLKCFNQMKIPRKDLRPYGKKMIGFTNHTAEAEGLVTLDVKLGEEPHTAERKVTFVVMNIESSYNAILGRPTLNALQAAISTYHLTMKFPADDGAVGRCRADQKSARECYANSCRTECPASLFVEETGKGKELRQSKDPAMGVVEWRNGLKNMELGTPEA